MDFVKSLPVVESNNKSKHFCLSTMETRREEATAFNLWNSRYMGGSDDTMDKYFESHSDGIIKLECPRNCYKIINWEYDCCKQCLNVAYHLAPRGVISTGRGRHGAAAAVDDDGAWDV